ERPTTQIIYEDGFVQVATDAVGDCGRGGLVEDRADMEPGELPSLAGRPSLGLVEISRDGDDRRLHRLAQESLGILLQMAEDEGGDLLGGALTTAEADALGSPHQPLDLLDRPFLQ